ncbi:phage major capsid protein [Cellulomonas shaoxiangyii]|uniref:Major capsid protein n=1 Tax=Cellulomonas shaoxiangyii TaxID=2566013 RepID=A0A4P7SKM8_9CELL|nr:phage major capsid protein [Cellulomonas shaoxiangyii]QCB93304.1 major capsid protein [Cellulomonas shaoxiangyii]TGY82477.1 major capsid protein [Cellulomonas shaoxiangyii]
MPALTTGSFVLPPQKLDPWLGKVQSGSVIAALSDSIPMKFGPGQSMTFDIGEAEYVAEGANKGGSTIVPTSVTATPFKFHKTVRWTNEVMWADEDDVIDVVEQVLNLIQPALSRALDYGVIHGINPTSGTAVAAMTQRLVNTTNVVETDDTPPVKPYTYLDAADTLVLADGYVPRDVALDPSFAAGFSTARGSGSEQKLYPNFQLSTAVSELDGHRASVSRTVGAVGVASTATNLKAIVGDFSAVRWGIQRAIGLEIIEYGDPDGGGDLKRNNQVAFRAEVVYGWGIADLNAFAKVQNATADV